MKASPCSQPQCQEEPAGSCKLCLNALCSKFLMTNPSHLCTHCQSIVNNPHFGSRMNNAYSLDTQLDDSNICLLHDLVEIFLKQQNADKGCNLKAKVKCISRIALEICNRVSIDHFAGDSFDISHYFSILEIDNSSNCEVDKLSYSIVGGIAFPGKLLHKKMTKCIRHPIIALFPYSLEYDFSDSSSSSNGRRNSQVGLDVISAQQVSALKWRQNLVDHLIRNNANLIFVKGRVSFDLQQLFYDNHISAIPGVSWDVLRRIARTLGCPIFAPLENEFVFGTCEHFELQKLRGLSGELHEVVVLEKSTSSMDQLTSSESHLSVLLFSFQDSLASGSSAISMAARACRHFLLQQSLFSSKDVLLNFHSLPISLGQFAIDCTSNLMVPPQDKETHQLSISPYSHSDFSLWQVLQSLSTFFSDGQRQYHQHGDKLISLESVSKTTNTSLKGSHCPEPRCWIVCGCKYIRPVIMKKLSMSISYHSLLHTFLCYGFGPLFPSLSSSSSSEHCDVCQEIRSLYFELPDSDSVLKMVLSNAKVYSMNSLKIVEGLEYPMNFKNELSALEEMIQMSIRSSLKLNLSVESNFYDILSQLTDFENIKRIADLKNIYCLLLTEWRKQPQLFETKSFKEDDSYCEELYDPIRDTLSLHHQSPWNVSRNTAFPSSCVPVFTNEPSSFFAHALASDSMHSFLNSHTNSLDHSSNTFIFNHSFDTNEYFRVSLFHPNQFDELSAQFGQSRLDLIESLSRCHKWKTSGGKSKAQFFQTHDDKYVLKGISEFETKQLEDLLVYYFDYFKENPFSSIIPFLGYFKLESNISPYSEGEAKYFVISPQLFHGLTMDVVFDLKGKRNARFVVEEGGQKKQVLQDGNLLHYDNGLPLIVSSAEFCSIWQTIERDTQFLQNRGIMDYSILLGLDNSSNSLVVGLIDYVTKFTLDKRIESTLKTVIQGSSTVLDPIAYRTRLLNSLQLYFIQQAHD